MTATNSTNIERRNIRVGTLTVRNSASGNGRTLVGKVAYNSKSEDLGGFREIIAPGAFTSSLRTNEVFSFWSHDTSQVLGRQSNGTLRLNDTSQALNFECDLDPKTTWGSNAIAALKRGDVTANSFGFAVDNDNVPGDTWEMLPDNTILRTVKRAILFEVSPVSVPAYPANEASIRNAPKAIRDQIVGQMPKETYDPNFDLASSTDCDCRCERCIDDDCANCENERCDDERCATRGCKQQQGISEDDAGERSRLLTSLLLRRTL